MDLYKSDKSKYLIRTGSERPLFIEFICIKFQHSIICSFSPKRKSALLWDIDINKDFKEWKWWLLLKRILCKWPKQLDFTIHCNFLVGSKVNYRVFQFLSVMDPAEVVQGCPQVLAEGLRGCKGTPKLSNAFKILLSNTFNLMHSKYLPTFCLDSSKTFHSILNLIKISSN